MIADLKPYPGYKESGIAWLGRVPRHWVPTRLKHAFKRIIGGSTPASGNSRHWNGGVTWVTPADVSRSERLRRSIRQISRVGMLSCSTEMVPKGSIILTSRAPVGNVAIAEVDLCTNQGCKALIPDHTVVAPMFGFWLLSIMKAELQSLSTGTTFSEISTSRLAAAFGVLPPPDEQAAIVRFLDWANGRLERAIRAKLKVIVLLNEQKQAIIHRAVTRGLDRSVPLKPSGIPWLGDIPHHWEVRRIKYLLREVDERSTTGSEPLLSMRMHHGLVLFAEHFSRPPQAATLVGFKIVRPGQFVVNRMQAGNGVIFASTLTGLVSPDYAVFDPIGDADVEFLGELFRSRTVRAKFRAESKGLGTGTSGFLRLYNDRFGAIHVALPPRAEQRNILTGVAGELSGVNTAISRLEREIELLREYRTRLVADVVTGKLDVREAAQLPEEATPDTAEDDTDLSIDPEAADEEVVV